MNTKKIFIERWFVHYLLDGIGFAIVGLWVIQAINVFAWIPAYFIIAIIAAYQASEDINKKLSKEHAQEINRKEQTIQVAIKQKELFEKEANLWKKSLTEKSAGFPTLLGEIDYYESLRDEKIENFLRYKSHPSVKGAQVVKEESARRRKAEHANRKTQSVIEYYESIAPFLVDLKDDIVDVDDDNKYRDYDEDEKLDPVIHYLTKEEYRKLPSIERNQMALDRFWIRPKSKWLLGRLYERFVGYIYENQGYDVEYFGIFRGYEDLGRDLICNNGKNFIIIQCKNWSKFKTIYEKHIFQFFGTVFQYKDANPTQAVRAIFYTTTQLSDLARRFASELGIGLKENFKFDKDYPSIKCNISKTDGSKIYHLPFDQQYDKTKIEKRRGEFYCSLVKEAEGAGFRRAFRWHGNPT